MVLLYKAIRKLWRLFLSLINYICTSIHFVGNGVKYKNFATRGVPYVMVARGGRMEIGENFAMNNGISHNPIGMPQPCTFFVDRGCVLTIGNNVGISQTALIAHADITIGNGACIATGSVVTKDVPPYAVVAGVPAKIIRYRATEENISKYSESRWWEKEPLKAYQELTK